MARGAGDPGRPHALRRPRPRWREFFRQIDELSERHHIDLESVTDVGEHVAVVGRHRIQRADGEVVAFRFVHTWTLRDGLVTAMTELVDSSALADARRPALTNHSRRREGDSNPRRTSPPSAVFKTPDARPEIRLGEAFSGCLTTVRATMSASPPRAASEGTHVGTVASGVD